MLRYCGQQTLCDIAFGVFMVTWFLARHVFYNAICWSLYADVFNKVMFAGCYDPVSGQMVSSGGGDAVSSNVLHAYMEDAGPVCFNPRLKYGFLALLLALQVITLLWFSMICRVAYNVISGRGADDSRSDDEGEEEEEEEEELDLDDQIRDFAEEAPEPRTARMQLQAPREEEVGVEDLHFVRKSPEPTQKKAARKSKGMSSGISIAGHGDKKELLGRIGCDKPGS